MVKLSMTRRTFSRIAAVTGATAMLSSNASVVSALAEDVDGGDDSGGIEYIRTSCRGCGKMECGTWATVQNGRVVKIEGDESAFQSAGNCCAKSQASLQAAYHPDRLRYPMKRTGLKGENPGWERIDWDEAYSLLGQKFTELQEKYGNETYFSMGGTSRIWAMAPYSAFKSCFGSPNAVQANEICKGPRFYATAINDSNAYSWMEVVGRPNVFVQWGGASELSNYDDSCRTTVDTAFRAASHILVDPRMTNLGKEADIWINLRPGTDGAVANCWANVIIENELYDDLYVRKWMNAPMLVIEENTFEPTPSSANSQSEKIKTRLLKESDILEGGSDTRFMVLNELDDDLSWYDAGGDNPGWEGETWTPATEGFVPWQNGLDATGQSQGFVLDYVPFPDRLFPALYTNEEQGREVILKDGTIVHVRTVWERYIEFLDDYTPEIVETISGVSADTLRKAAITYATRVDPSTGFGNGGIQYMLAGEHACNATQNNRACDLVAGITGNMDTPGGMRGSTPGWPSMDLGMTMPSSKRTRTYDSSKIIGADTFTMIGSDCGPGWADATCVYRAIETGEPYPLTCGIGQTGDFMNQSNSLNNYEQLKKIEFWVSIDLWHTPTTEIADLLLPAAHWLEVDCIRKSQGSSGGNGATIRCVQPPGEAKSDLEIVIGIYKAMGVPYTDEAGNEWPLDDADNVCNGIALGGLMTWQEYREQYQESGWWDNKIKKSEDWGTYRRYQIGNGHISGGFPPVEVQHQGWNTTTHKQEIWSTVFESWLVGQDEEFPRFVEAPHGPVADPEFYEDENSFLMTTGRRQGTYFHSEHRQLPWCRELWPVPRLEMNPVDAARLHLEQGDWVWIETDWGKIREVVDLYYGIEEGVVNAEHQWWFPELDQPDRGFKLSGVNCLIDKDAQDRIIGSSNLRAYGVKVYKATSENSPFNNPIPCGDDGIPIIYAADDARLKNWLPDYEGRGE